MPTLIPHHKLAGLLGEQTVKSSAKTVGALFKEIEARISPADWAQAKKCIIIVNGRALYLLHGMDTKLAPDDQVWMVFPSAGG